MVNVSSFIQAIMLMVMERYTRNTSGGKIGDGDSVSQDSKELLTPTKFHSKPKICVLGRLLHDRPREIGYDHMTVQ